MKKQLSVCLGANDKFAKLILPNVWGNVDKIDLGKYMFLKTGDTVGNEEFGEATKHMAGKTMVAFPTKERVKIETLDKTVVYNGRRASGYAMMRMEPCSRAGSR